MKPVRLKIHGWNFVKWIFQRASDFRPSDRPGPSPRSSSARHTTGRDAKANPNALIGNALEDP
jgi:hypothetical protein